MLSVVILTKNEESRIKVCLESVKWFDEIIVIDNGSSDKTLEIAKKYTTKIFKSENDDFALARNKGIKEAKGEWVLYVDSDERVLEPLKMEIQNIIASTDKSAYAIRRQNIIFGHQVTYGPYQNDWMVRLFRKADFETWWGKLHESAKFKGKLGYIKNPLLHLTHRDIDQVVLKSLEWSKIDAKLRYETGHPKMTGARFISILVKETFNQTIKRKGLFGGSVGIIDSMLQVFSLFITYIRLWQLQQEKPLNEIYSEIDKKLLDNGFKNV